jgi:hypothetical protein
MTVAHRLVAAALVAAGITLVAGAAAGLVLGGLGYAWSGPDIFVAAGVNRLLMAARRRGDSPQHMLPEDPPAPAAAASYDEAA